ncbi:MAG: methylmalonyl-CoA mutase [Thermoplasmata archaeon]|nr:MAG: methylmalonyl-CoA mutase [Thermoplasmata archaeon]HDJ27016.1 cobalamin B12-binding domain-containing protein [Aciduliprofundum sp.]
MAVKGKILVAKLGLDGHDRGAKVLARGLMEEGFQVIYTGIRKTPEQVAEAALQEGVSAVLVSILSGSHMYLVPRLLEELRKRGLGDLPVLVGGIIPPDDARKLKEMGVLEVFGPGSFIKDTAQFLRRILNA